MTENEIAKQIVDDAFLIHPKHGIKRVGDSLENPIKEYRGDVAA